MIIIITTILIIIIIIIIIISSSYIPVYVMILINSEGTTKHEMHPFAYLTS